MLTQGTNISRARVAMIVGLTAFLTLASFGCTSGDEGPPPLMITPDDATYEPNENRLTFEPEEEATLEPESPGED